MEMRSYSDLPEEISFDILSRLPAKSVGQYRCVSKPWKELFYRPEFIKAHLQSSRIVPNESLVLDSSSHRCLVSASLSDAQDPLNNSAISTTRLRLSFTNHRGARVHGSCDGLVLVGDGDVRLCVVNPITREIRVIPPSPFDRIDVETHGFGYDSVNHDYKVVALRHRHDKYGILFGMCADVYSLRKGSWKRGSSIVPFNVSIVTHAVPAAFVNGCIHWTVWRVVDLELAIIAFNAEEEELRELPLPSSDDGGTCRFDPAMLYGTGGYLWMFSSRESERETDVWVMKQYGVQESWTKVATIAAAPIKPVGLSRQDDLVIYEISSKSFIYNLKQGTVKDIVVDDTLVPVASFIESLVSPCNNEAW